MNKKGNFPDVVEWMGVALTLGFVIVLCAIIYNNFDAEVQNLNDTQLGINASVVKSASAATATAIPKLWDYLFVFILLIFIVFSVTAARLIPSSPKFIIISILAMIFLPFGAMIIGNVWDGFNQQSAISSVTSSLPFISYIMDHLVVVVLIYVTLIAISLLTKTGDPPQ